MEQLLVVLSRTSILSLSLDRARERGGASMVRESNAIARQDAGGVLWRKLKKLFVINNFKFSKLETIYKKNCYVADLFQI